MLYDIRSSLPKLGSRTVLVQVEVGWTVHVKLTRAAQYLRMMFEVSRLALLSIQKSRLSKLSSDFMVVTGDQKSDRNYSASERIKNSLNILQVPRQGRAPSQLERERRPENLSVEGKV